MYIMRAFSGDKLQIKQFMPVNSIAFTVKRLDLSWTFFSHIRPKVSDYRQTWGQYPPPSKDLSTGETCQNITLVKIP